MISNTRVTARLAVSCTCPRGLPPPGPPVAPWVSTIGPDTPRLAPTVHRRRQSGGGGPEGR
eukprot:3385745-Alexandrium_andersonii.AAC.1